MDIANCIFKEEEALSATIETELKNIIFPNPGSYRSAGNEIKRLSQLFSTTKESKHIEEINTILDAVKKHDPSWLRDIYNLALHEYVYTQVPITNFLAKRIHEEIVHTWPELKDYNDITPSRIIDLKTGQLESGVFLDYDFVRPFISVGCYHLSQVTSSAPSSTPHTLEPQKLAEIVQQVIHTIQLTVPSTVLWSGEPYEELDAAMRITLEKLRKFKETWSDGVNQSKERVEKILAVPERGLSDEERDLLGVKFEQAVEAIAKTSPATKAVEDFIGEVMKLQVHSASSSPRTF
jgi:hypothetical protein